MTLQGRVSLLAVVVCSLAAAGARASTDMYIKFEDPAIEASGTARGHEKEIEVLSWSHGFAQPTSPTRSAAGAGTVEQANHHTLTFTKDVDTSTNTLLKYCWSGKQIGKATLSCYRSDGADNKPVKYLEVVMEHVIISNYSVSGSPGDIPIDNVSLDFGVVQYTYFDQKHPHGVNGPAVKGLTASARPAPKALTAASTPCSMKLASGKSIPVRSQALDATKTLTFTTDSDAESDKPGTMTLTCGGQSAVLEEAKVTNVTHSGKSHTVSVKFAAMR